MTNMHPLPRRRWLLLGLWAFGATPALAAPAVAPPPKHVVSIGSAKDEDIERPVFRVNRDQALMRGLLYAFDPSPAEIRAIAVEDLGLLGDPRALNALAQLVLDYNPRVAAAALRAVGLIRHPRAEEILSNVIRHPTLGEGLKVQAVTLLPFQNTESALRFVKIVARTQGWPQSVQQRAQLMAQDVPAGRGGMP